MTIAVFLRNVAEGAAGNLWILQWALAQWPSTVEHVVSISGAGRYTA
jgi:hypothetical protein